MQHAAAGNHDFDGECVWDCVLPLSLIAPPPTPL